MSPIPVLDATRIWECPSCAFRHQAAAVGIQSKYHNCPNQRGLSVPLVDVTSGQPGQRIRHLAVEREDYIGREIGVRFDASGRAVSAVRTERFDGSNDTTVYAPTATNSRGSDK